LLSQSLLAFGARISSVVSRRKFGKPAGLLGLIGGISLSLAVACVATFTYLFICEVLVRISTHSLFRFQDFRNDRVQSPTTNTAIDYDPVVGWVMKPDHSTAYTSSPPYTVNTLKYGLRSNGEPFSELPSGGVLAVGSSFTAGSEVSDVETWPAQLRRMLNLPVYNGGVGGYGADQIILRAEQLMPLLRPKVLIVDLLADNILGVTYSSYGRPKPYFLVEHGALVAHNQPVPKVEQDLEGGDAKHWFAHSIVVSRFMEAFFSDWWFAGRNSSFSRTSGDEVEITCRLLHRLKKKTDEGGVRLILYLQFAGSHIIGGLSEPPHAALVHECAQSLGIQTVDEFGALAAIYRGNANALRENYVRKPDGSTGHKSPLGNGEVARRVAAALLESPQLDHDAAAVADYADTTEKESAVGPYRNFFSDSESIPNSDRPGSIVSLTCVRGFWPLVRTYRLAASGPPGEHYFAVDGIDLSPGYVSASLEVKPDQSGKFRVQLFGPNSQGAVADFDLANRESATIRLGKVRSISSGVEAAGFGWYRAWLTFFSPVGGRGAFIIQLAEPSGRYDFAAARESVLIRKIQITKGRSVPAYQTDVPIVRRVRAAACM